MASWAGNVLSRRAAISSSTRSHPVVAEIMGWSMSTAIRMIKEVYGHISLATRQRAIELRESFMELQLAAVGAQKGAQSLLAKKVTVQ